MAPVPALSVRASWAACRVRPKGTARDWAASAMAALPDIPVRHSSLLS